MKTPRARAALAIVAALLLSSAAPAPSTAASQKAYSQPDAAVEAFIAELRDFDLDALLQIFGADSRGLFVSEDPVDDENLRGEFLALYDKHHELAPKNEQTRILVVGPDRWPFPIPLVASAAGWTFDTAAGMDEIIDRRVGRNELAAIQTCLAVGDAQREYFRQDRDGDGILEYAQLFRSTAGKKDGLYWAVAEGEPLSPIGEFVARAADEGYGPENDTYHGYRYRLLSSQGAAAPGGAYEYIVRGDQIGGFTVVAYPAAYGDSGVMTFMLSHAGVVYQKDLGERTEAEARNLKSFDPKGWTQVSESDLAPLPE